MLFCAPIVGLWYWCTDQHIVQRTFMAPNETEARRGTIFGAFLKLLPVFIFIIPGMIALALAKTGKVAGARRRWSTPAGNPVNAVTQGRFRCWCATCCRSACAAWSWPACWRR